MAMALKLFLMLLLFLGIRVSTPDAGKGNFIYNGFKDANMSLDGVALVQSNGLLQLTSGSAQQIGRAFYVFPLNFTNSSQSSFSTSFVFAIVSEIPDLAGHGIAFTISPSMRFPGATGSQYLGLFNLSNNGNYKNHVVAIELDTIQNPELQDINNNHVGIDVNSLISNESTPAAYYDTEGKNKSLNLISGEPLQVWIDYNGEGRQLNVTLSPSNVPKPDRPLLSSTIDLSLVFLDSMYVGFSSATGSLRSNHYILGWSFRMNGLAQALNFSLLPLLPRMRQSRGNRDLEVGLSLAAVLFVLTAIIGIVYFRRKKKYAEAELLEDWEQDYGPHRFSYKDLSIATKGFKDKELLGAGGFGRVYRGILPTSNTQVAVKRVSHDSKQGIKEFVAEIVSIGRLRHRNLVQLLGYCRRRGELLLVYDFMSNGSLDKFLFSSGSPILTWSQRYKIIRGVASGLLYLHEEWEQVVLHRDVKASNVLLDDDLNGRLGDFGLARLYDHGTNPQTTHVVGTLGYLAPEISRTGKATTSSDVFSFGAFLLEVACGRRPIENQSLPEEMILVDWVSGCWRRGGILETRDPGLGDDYVKEELELALKLGLLCSHPLVEARPSMRQIMQYLDGDAILPDLSSDGVGINVIGTMSAERHDDFIKPYDLYPSSSERGSTPSYNGSIGSTLSGGR